MSLGNTEDKNRGLLVSKGIDLLLAVAWAVATVFVVLFAPLAEPARITLALVFVLFLPGYVLVAALFPRNDDLDPVERIALSLGLSVAVVPPIGLGLNYSPWGIRLNPILAFVALFIVLTAAVAILRRLTLPSDQAMSLPVSLALAKWRGLRVADRVLGLVLVVALGGLGVAAYLLATSSAGSEDFTEFYVLGPGGRAEGYPRALAVGDEFVLILGVVNHEGEDVRYRVQATIAGRRVASLDNLRLANDERSETPLTLRATQPGGNQKVELVLYKGGEGAPYRTLHLWLDVEAAPPDAAVSEAPEPVGTLQMPPPGVAKPLYEGCNNVGLTFPDGTPSQTVVDAVEPARVVEAVWRLDAAQKRWQGFSPTAAAAGDLQTVDFLDSISLCVSHAPLPPRSLPSTDTPSPTSTPPESPPPALPGSAAFPSGLTYVVQPGDTLTGIGAAFGLHFTEIAAANGIADTNLIHPGQVLTIPGTGP